MALRERRPYKVEVIKTIVGTIEVMARTPEEAESIVDSDLDISLGQFDNNDIEVIDTSVEISDAYPASERDYEIGE